MSANEIAARPNKGMKLTKPGQLRSFAAYPRCSADVIDGGGDDGMAKQQRIRVTAAVNRILWPRLRQLGFRHHFAEDGPNWKEGSTLDRTGPNGREQGLLMGRDKFGHTFGLNVCRKRADGSYEWLDLEKVGIPRPSLQYSTQGELEAVLERVANAIETAVIPWLDGG